MFDLFYDSLIGTSLDDLKPDLTSAVNAHIFLLLISRFYCSIFIQEINQLSEFFRVAKQEIMALTQMAEQINSKFSAQHQQNQKKSESLPNGVKANSESVDLDNLFAFLSEVTPNGQNSNSKAIISEIGEKMNHLVEDLDVELESVIQQEIEGLTNERNLINSQHQAQPNNTHQHKPQQLAQKQQPIPPQQQQLQPPIQAQTKLG